MLKGKDCTIIKVTNYKDSGNETDINNHTLITQLDYIVQYDLMISQLLEKINHIKR